jgi:hypothetical protein
VASNLIKINQGKKKKTPNGKQGSPPFLLEIAATVPPISSSNSKKGSTHQTHIAPVEEVVLGLKPPKHPFRIAVREGDIK